MLASYLDEMGTTHSQSNARPRSVMQPDRLRTLPARAQRSVLPTAPKLPPMATRWCLRAAARWRSVELAYDPRKDFTPVALVVRVPFILVVNPSMPIKSVADLISYAKAHPGALTYGSGGAGSLARSTRYPAACRGGSARFRCRGVGNGGCTGAHARGDCKQVA